MRLKLMAAFVATMLLSADAMATACDLTDFPSSGTLTRTALNARLAQIESCINGNIGTGNITASEPIALSKIANQNSYQYVSRRLPCGTKTDSTAFKLPVASTLKGASFYCNDCGASDSETIVIQVDSSTAKTFAAIATDTVQSDFTLSTAVSTSAVVNIDTTEGAHSACTSYDLVLAFVSQHQP